MTPKHYRMNIQPLQYIMSNGLGFCEGNIVKYISRYKDKGGIDDLLKAQHYLDVLISQYSGKEDPSMTVNGGYKYDKENFDIID